MIGRITTVVSLAFLCVSSGSAQTYDPAAEQLGMQAFFSGSCSGGASDESSHCTWVAIADADGSHLILLPQSGASGQPSWSPDGRSLVSARDNVIFITSATGAPETHLTDNSWINQTPAWSPDGTKIAFASDRGGSMDLYVMNPDGSGVTHLATGTGAAWAPAWSPNGARLAFNCEDSSLLQQDVCAINIDGSGFVQLTKDPSDDFDPAWSRDGSTILFSTKRFGGFIGDTDYPRTELALMNAVDGSNVVPVSPGTHAFSGTWSMDGSRIAYQSFDPYSNLGYGSVPTVGVMNADGTGATDIATGSNPTWRPMTGVGTNNRPAAAFTSSCANGVCTLDGTVSSDSDGSVTAFGWQFGDGTTGSGATPAHTFVTGRAYGVTLIAMDNLGALATTWQTLDLNQPPVASFTWRCNGLTCTFDGSASRDPDGTLYYYSWEFGDYRGGSGMTVTHAYPAAGSYVVRLTVYDNGNKTSAQTQTITTGNAPPTASFTFACSNRTCTFDGSGSSDLDGTVASYAWNFGDGATGAGQTATHTFTAPNSYTVTLTVTDNGAATGTQSKTVTIVNAAPAASFTFACNTRTCTFDGSGSSDADGTLVNYAWNFGDGSAGTGQTASHTYTLSGNYTATLTVTDNDAATATQSKPVAIINTAPAASFTFACSGLTCSFNGSASSDIDGTIASYAWTFGDGMAASGQAAAHTYSAPGNYNVTLTVTDNLGATNAITHGIAVTQPEVHVGDLDGATQNLPGTWNATVTVRIHDNVHNSVANATVNGSWSSGQTGTCTTSANGSCSISLSSIPNKTGSAAFSVTLVTYANSTYRSASNHDPDGDSNGTTITLKRP